jgi:hypothetical protein
VALGIEMRALAELISKSHVRVKLMKRVREQEERIRQDLDSMARFNALLGWYYEEVYPPTKMSDNDGREHIEQSNMCRAVAKQIDLMTRTIESRERRELEIRSQFITASIAYSNSLDDFTRKLEDGKRAFKPEAGQTRVLKAGG